MRKRFNVTGLCVSEKYYMADLTERIAQIQEMIDSGANLLPDAPSPPVFPRRHMILFFKQFIKMCTI